MPKPRKLFNEPACFDALKAFLVAACSPEITSQDIYRSHPGASPEAKGRPSVVMIPLQGGPPVRLSPMGESNVGKQIQVVQVQFFLAAVGTWKVNLLGETAEYVAGGGDTTMSIRDGLRVAVDLLGLPVTTSVTIVGNAPTLLITANTAGVSMGVNQLTPGDIPAGGQSLVVVVDDNLAKVQFNWGTWTIRLVFRAPPPVGGGMAAGSYTTASDLCDRVMCWLEAQRQLPLVNGLAYPYWLDQLLKGPARLAWRNTLGPFSVPEVEGNTWIRAVAIDVVFDVPVGLVFDIPSLDTLGAGTLILSPA